MTGTRRRYSEIHLPERLARMLGLSDEESVITIEHYDEGLSSSEIPYISGLWSIKDEEQKKASKRK